MQEIMTSEMEPGGNKNSAVKLEQKFVGAQVKELYAYMAEYQCILTHINSGHKNKSFAISAEAMDSLASAWFAFRAECKAVEEAEAVRVKAVKAEVYDIAEKNNIDIKENNDGYERPYYVVACGKISFYKDAIYSIDGLLSGVKNAETKLAVHRTIIAKIRTIIAEYPAIKVHAYTNENGSSQWNVEVPSLDWKTERCSTSAQTFYEQICTARDMLIEHRARPALPTPDTTPSPAD